MEPVPDAVNAEGSCFWVLGLFVIMIIKHLSTVYTMVYKYVCSGLQTGARFLLPLETVAGIPWRLAASRPLGKIEQPRLSACVSREVWLSVSPCPCLLQRASFPPCGVQQLPPVASLPYGPGKKSATEGFVPLEFLELAQLAGYCPGMGWSSFLTAVSRYQDCEPGSGSGNSNLLPRGLLTFPPVPSFIWPRLR